MTTLPTTTSLSLFANVTASQPNLTVSATDAPRLPRLVPFSAQLIEGARAETINVTFTNPSTGAFTATRGVPAYAFTHLAHLVFPVLAIAGVQLADSDGANLRTSGGKLCVADDAVRLLLEEILIELKRGRE